MDGEGFMRRWSRLKSDASAEVRLPGRPSARLQADSAEVKGTQSNQDAALVRRQNDTGSTPESGSTSAIPSTSVSPTLQDAMHLTSDSDYSAFMARGVDKNVRRLAMKKLFADPHFNQLDGLDIYMGDYNRADPLPAPMLAALRQARDFLQEQLAPGENEPDDTDATGGQGGSGQVAGGDSSQTENSEPGRNES